MAGMEWKLPVVVLMTMNPPGYDSTARRLSAPLAARISRTYRLATPDLDNLCDRIVAKRLLATRVQFEAQSEIFPDCPPELLRRACMVTLCLWGNPDRKGAESRSALYCLTVETRDLVRRLVDADADLKREVERMETLCAYGPDGRAAGDWITAAIGYAVREQKTRQTGEQPVLRVEHLQKTLIETIAGKIYDSFSPASSPDKTLEKQKCLKAIAHHVLNMRIDDPADADRATLTRRIDGRGLVADFPRMIESPSDEKIRELFVLCQVTTNGEYARWSSVARIDSRSRQSLYNKFVAQKIVVVSNEAGDFRQAVDTSLESNSPLPVQFRKDAPVWAKPAWRLLAQALADEIPDANADAKRLREISKTINSDLQSQMKGILQIVRDAVEPIEGVLAQYESVRRITVVGFVAICDRRGVARRDDRVKVAETLEDLWRSRESGPLLDPLETCLREAIAELIPHVPRGHVYRALRNALAARIAPPAPSRGTDNR